MSHVLRILSESEAGLDTFHDCHVHGLVWGRPPFGFSIELQYILEWIAPTKPSTAYRFSISEARLTFVSVSDLKVSMDWSASALDAEIGVVNVVESRSTPNGQIERYFEIEFANPEGTISFWSTGYEIHLLHEPVISDGPTIPIAGEG